MLNGCALLPLHSIDIELSPPNNRQKLSGMFTRHPYSPCQNALLQEKSHFYGMNNCDTYTWIVFILFEKNGQSDDFFFIKALLF